MTTSSFNNHHLHPKLFGHPKFHQVSEKEKRILGTVMQREQISQTRLAGLTGIAQQSVSRTVKHLIARGTLCTGKKIVSGNRGQQQTNLEIAPDFAYSFGISIMTDVLHICAMDFSGKVLGEEHASLLPMKQSTVIRAAKKNHRQPHQRTHRSTGKDFRNWCKHFRIFCRQGNNYQHPSHA